MAAWLCSSISGGERKDDQAAAWHRCVGRSCGTNKFSAINENECGYGEIWADDIIIDGSSIAAGERKWRWW
jgi:hypothetical protein